MDVLAIVHIAFGAALLLGAPMVLVFRRRIGEYMAAGGFGKGKSKNPSADAAGIGVLQALLGGALIAYGVIDPGGPARAPESIFDYAAPALLALSFLIVYASFVGGAVGLHRERERARARAASESTGTVRTLRRESLRAGRGAFLVIDGALVSVTAIWLFVVLLIGNERTANSAGAVQATGAVPVVLFVGAAVMILGGPLMIVFRRRVGANLAQAGMIPREGNLPAVMAAGFGIALIVGGVMLAALAVQAR